MYLTVFLDCLYYEYTTYILLWVYGRKDINLMGNSLIFAIAGGGGASAGAAAGGSDEKGLELARAHLHELEETVCEYARLVGPACASRMCYVIDDADY